MNRRTNRTILTVVALTAVLLAPALADAQAAVQTASGAVIGMPASAAPIGQALDGPRIERAGVSFTNGPIDRMTPLRFHDRRSGAAWMIAGGATLLAGAVTGGDSGSIVMIAGGALFVFGLFDYTR